MCDVYSRNYVWSVLAAFSKQTLASRLRSVWAQRRFLLEIFFPVQLYLFRIFVQNIDNLRQSLFWEVTYRWLAVTDVSALTIGLMLKDQAVQEEYRENINIFRPRDP